MSWLHPFVTLLSALDRTLPDRLRGVVACHADSDPADLPARARVRAELPAAAVLWREIPVADVPPGMAPDRRAAWIEARLEPLSPWAPGAYLWAEDPAAPGLRLALTAAGPVRRFEAALNASGRSLVEVQLGPVRLALDGGRIERRARVWGRIWLLTMALGAGLAALALWQIQSAHAEADRAAERLSRFAAEAAAQGDRARAILALGRAPHGLTEPLNRLAAALPMDSYLLTLRLTPQDFQIAGQSAAPDAIVPALQAGGFAGVDFAGGSTLDAASGLYSFTLHGLTGGAP